MVNDIGMHDETDKFETVRVLVCKRCRLGLVYCDNNIGLSAMISFALELGSGIPAGSTSSSYSDNWC